tara:strand:+ start:995 stop:1726 length:732 start_codon:yes stop_codon:yes gene_type:complete
MGLQAGSSEGSEMRSTFLGVAGGYIWDKKADKSDPNFKTQEYKKLGDEVGVRQGAQYKALNGKVVGVRFNNHEQYGESILVTLVSDGEAFIISIGTNNRYSQDMMKGLLKMDFSKPILLTPYDFIDKKTSKRVQGISFKQDGNKIALRNDDAPFDSNIFSSNDKRKVKRFFEDLTQWFVDEVTEKVIDVHFPKGDDAEEAQEPVAKKPVAKTPVTKTPKVEDVVKEAEVSESDLDASLEALLG